jgi:uncharacterized protein GlcG (DUF336 family)
MADHFVHRLQTSMPLATAEKIADGALKAGGEAGLLPLTVAVLDVGGHLVVLKRQDGSGNLRADIAIGKAAGALGISGDASDKDEYAAITGVHRAGLKTHPEEPALNWREAGL